MGGFHIKIWIFFWKIRKPGNLGPACDEVQDTLPQNLALWHIEHFNLKKFEKMAKTGRSLIFSPPVFPKAGLKTLMWKMPSYTWREKNIFISRGWNTQKDPNKQALLSFPQFLHIIELIPFTPPYLSTTVHSSSNLE